MRRSVLPLILLLFTKPLFAGDESSQVFPAENAIATIGSYLLVAAIVGAGVFIFTRKNKKNI